ncbi:11795_t:CDS:2, partial [Acaulospora colombiana]
PYHEREFENNRSNGYLKNDARLDASRADRESTTLEKISDTFSNHEGEYWNSIPYLHQEISGGFGLRGKFFETFVGVDREGDNRSIENGEFVGHNRFSFESPTGRQKRVDDLDVSTPRQIKNFENSLTGYSTDDDTFFDSPRHPTESYPQYPNFERFPAACQKNNAIFDEVHIPCVAMNHKRLPVFTYGRNNVFNDNDDIPLHKTENFENRSTISFAKEEAPVINEFETSKVSMISPSDDSRILKVDNESFYQGASASQDPVAPHQVNERFTSEDSKKTVCHKAFSESSEQPVPIGRRGYDKLDVVNGWNVEKSCRKYVTSGLDLYFGRDSYGDARGFKMRCEEKTTADAQKLDLLQFIQTVEDTREIDRSPSDWGDHANFVARDSTGKWMETSREVSDCDHHSTKSTDGNSTWSVTDGQERHYVPPREGVRRKGKKLKKKDHWGNDSKRRDLDGARSRKSIKSHEFRRNYHGRCVQRHNLESRAKSRNFDVRSHKHSSPKEWGEPELANDNRCGRYLSVNVNTWNLWWPWGNEEDFERDLMRMIKREKKKVLRHLNSVTNKEVEEGEIEEGELTQDGGEEQTVNEGDLTIGKI